MIARIRKSMQEKDQGFTLIELLVVMIIIGILAAIAIPVFLNQRKKAAETAAKADVSTIGKEIAAYYVDGTNALNLTDSGATTPVVWSLAEAGAAAGVTVTSGNLTSKNHVVMTRINSGTDFCVGVDPNLSVTGAATWYYSQTGLSKTAC